MAFPGLNRKDGLIGDGPGGTAIHPARTRRATCHVPFFRTAMISKEARRYDSGLLPLEFLVLRNLRKRLLEGAGGRILEIGIGTGANLPYYRDPGLLAGIDRREGLLSGAFGKARGLPFAPCLADASAIPFPDDCFDTVVGTLVFCSLPDVRAALGEIRRVLRPGGHLLMIEHVRGRGPLTRRITDWLQPFWFALQGECHLNRETEARVIEAGFRIEESEIHGHGMILLLQAGLPA